MDTLAASMSESGVVSIADNNVSGVLAASLDTGEEIVSVVLGTDSLEGDHIHRVMVSSSGVTRTLLSGRQLAGSAAIHDLGARGIHIAVDTVDGTMLSWSSDASKRIEGSWDEAKELSAANSATVTADTSGDVWAWSDTGSSVELFRSGAEDWLSEPSSGGLETMPLAIRNMAGAWLVVVDGRLVISTLSSVDSQREV